MTITDFRLKIRDFFRRNKIRLIVIIVAWIGIIIVNKYLENTSEPEIPKTTYSPHTAVMDDSVVPTKLQSPIEQLIEKYVDFCNAKDYENAYNLLTDECKKNVFSDNIDNFKEYIDSVFDTKKIYNIQNFSNKDGTYIYTVTILNDIMASGLTNEVLETYEETVVIIDNGTDDLKLSIKGYIKNENMDRMYEDEYIKINVTDLKVEYEYLTYKLTIRNKTENIVVLEDFSTTDEIYLDTDYGKRKRTDFLLEPIVIYPGETKYYDFNFTKFYDEKAVINGLVFANVRILKSYSGSEDTRQSELDNAVSRYSITLDV